MSQLDASLNLPFNYDKTIIDIKKGQIRIKMSDRSKNKLIWIDQIADPKKTNLIDYIAEDIVSAFADQSITKNKANVITEITNTAQEKYQEFLDSQ